MNENFKKFKNKIIRHAIIESVIAGVASGLLVVAVLLFAFTFIGTDLAVWIYVVAGVAVAAVVGGVVFLILRPTDKKIARRLDKDLAFNEKVQTMVAYSRSQDSLAGIQRHDTAARLAAAGTSKIKFRRTWQCAVASVLAAGVFAGAIVYSVLNVKEPTYADFTDWQVLALRNLIESVESNARFDDECKQSIVGELNPILDAIYDEETDTTITLEESQMLSLVTGAMVNIDAAVENMITAEEFGLAFNQAVSDTSLMDMGIHVAALNTNTVRTEFSNIKYRLDDSSASAASQSIKDIAAAVDSALATVGASTDAGLYASFAAFSAGISAVADSSDEIDEIQSAYSDAIDAASIAVSAEVGVQASVRESGREVIYRLQEIFEISDENMPELHAAVEDVVSDSGSGDDNKGDDGGAGRGEVDFAGDSTIYWHNEGRYCEYGEALTAYYAIYSSIMDSLGQEYNDFLTAYFNGLTEGGN